MEGSYDGTYCTRRQFHVLVVHLKKPAWLSLARRYRFLLADPST